MKAMILAAGRGERMRPLSDYFPKVLLPVKDKPLIVWHIERLAQAGIHNIVINIAYKPEMIQDCLGDGRRFGVRIDYSLEPPGGLEAGGGIKKALSLLGDPFIVISGDVFCEYPVAQLPSKLKKMAHLVVVENPSFHPGGDFYLARGCLSYRTIGPAYTYAGLGIFHAKLFHQEKQPVSKITAYLDKYIDNQMVSAEVYRGIWCNMGTVPQWQELNRLRWFE